MKTEQLVKYNECGTVRILRGKVINEEKEYIILERRDGLYRLYKHNIIYIQFLPEDYVVR